MLIGVKLNIAHPPKLPDSMVFFERDWLSSNNVLFFDTDGTTLVDSGYKKHAALTIALVNQALIERRPTQPTLDRIINTHLHSDHCGGNSLLQSSFANIKTFIHRDCAKAVRTWDENELTFTATAQECDRFKFTDTVKDGDLFALGGTQWRAIQVPGHDHTMFALYCEEFKILISADALWENGFGINFPELDGRSGFKEHRHTLDLLGNLEVQIVIPGHGPMFSDFGGALVRAHSKLDYLQSNPARHAHLAAKVLVKFMLLDKEKLSFDELVKRLSQAHLFQTLHSTLGWTDVDASSKVLVNDLIEGGVARVADGWIYNV
jgi:glyoxylase-like metal-dependent hydrolase (beta-lactamase superfamily II)